MPEKIFYTDALSRKKTVGKMTEKSGFALLLTLFLTAFVLLLLLMITSRVRLETQTVAAGIHEKKARSYAMLGIKQALAELQKETGKDQITTANADLFVNSENSLSIVSPFWVGVWDTRLAWESDPDQPHYVNQIAWDSLSQEEKLSKASRWLVSGGDRDSDLYPLPIDSIEPNTQIEGIPVYAKLATIPDTRALPDSTRLEAVYAPKEFLRLGTNDMVEGTYAWWVADEGTKAKINVPDRHWGLEDATQDRAAYRANLSPRPVPDLIINDNEYEPTLYQDLLDLDMLSYFDTLSPPPLEGQSLRQDYFFDFTPSSYGVLTDPRQGGLKKDLSIAFDIADAFTKDVQDLKTFDPEKLDPFFHLAISDDTLPRNDPNYRDNYLFLLEDVVYEPADDIYNGTGGSDPIAGPPWNLLAYHHNLYQLTSESDTIKAPLLFNEETSSQNWINQGIMGQANTYNSQSKELSSEAFVYQLRSLYKAQSKHSVHLDTWGTNNTSTLDLTEEPTTYSITPILTEFKLSIEIEYTNAGEIIVHYIPMLELTNPYDIEINLDDADSYDIILWNLHALIDFRLTPNATGQLLGIGQNIWSGTSDAQNTVDNRSNDGLPIKIFTGGHHPNAATDGGQAYSDGYKVSSDFRQRLRARFLNNMNFSQVNNGTFKRTATSYSSKENFRIQAAELGNFGAGEIKTFVFDTSRNDDQFFFMVEGTAPTSKTRELRSYTMLGPKERPLPQYLENDPMRGYQTGQTGDSIAQDNGLWPSHPSYYDNLEVEVLSAPAYEFDRSSNAYSTIAEPLRMRIFFKCPKKFHIQNLDLRQHNLRDTNGNTLDCTAKTFNLSKGEQINVLTLRIYQSSEDEMEALVSKDHFLGGSNPRAPFITIDSGFQDNNGLTHAPTFRLEVDENPPSSMDTSTLGSWGNLGISNTNTPLFHVPRRRPISIGDYRHANLSRVAHEPAMPLGNSIIPPFGWDDNQSDTWKSWLSPLKEIGKTNTGFNFVNDTINTRIPVQNTNILIDNSYHINTALWDSYYLSTLTKDTIESFVTADPNDPLSILPNSRNIGKNGNQNTNTEILSDFRRNAGELLVDGAFNVNSTSVKAWGSLLRSMQSITPEGSNSALDDIFLRNPLLPTETEDEWKGATPLDPALLYNRNDTAYTDSPQSLAGNIVQEVKARGPFMSLAHFVNRNLIDGDSRSNSGALHSAIKNSKINGSQNPFAPGSLSQADLMGALGSSLTSRSDTFVIRAKGESFTGSTGELKAEVWCEAVVQRLPNYFDDSESPHITPESTDNITFGRRYQITSIRWLSADEV